MSNAKPRAALRPVLVYAIIAGLYVLLSNRLLSLLTSDPRLLTSLDTVKDEAFVLVTALILYLLLRRELRKIEHRDEQIREIEQRLHLQSRTLESAANAIVLTDREGRITWVNPAFTGLTGYTAAEVHGRNPRLLKSDVHDQAFYRRLWDTILSGQVWRGELVNRRKDGRLYVEEMTITPVLDAGGAISHFIGVMQDITERKQAEGALRESEEKFRNLVEKTSDWVWEIDERNRYTYVSPRVREILGYAPEEVLGKTPFDLMPAEEAKRVAEAFAPITGEMKPFVLFDNVSLHKDGHPVVLETSGTPIFDNQGVFRGYRGIDRDITERKRAEAALRESEERYRLLFESNPHPMWVYNVETLAFLAVNDAAVRHYGYSRDEFLAMTIKDIRPPEDIPALLENVARVTSGLDEAGIWRHRKKDGTIIQVEITSHTLTFAGRPAEVVLANDVTARRQAEAALLARTRQLEAVRTVTAEITQKLDLTTLLGLLIRRAVELIGAGTGVVWLWDEAEQCLVPQAWHGPSEWLRGQRLRLGEGVIGTVAARRTGLLVPDYPASPYAHPISLARPITAVLAEPLLYRDRLVGVIGLDNEGTGRPLTEPDRETLALFAAQATIAIENARLFHEEQARRAQLESVRAVVAEITRELDLPTLLSLITRRAAELVAAGSGAVWLWDDAGEVLLPSSWHGHGPWLGEMRLRLGEGVAGTVAQRRESLILNDYRTSPFAHPRFLAQTDITAVLAEPLVYRDRLLGVITLDNIGVGRGFTDQDRNTLVLFAAHAAIAIENARLHSAAVRRGAEFEALLRATHSIMSGLDLQGIFDRILAEATQISGCSHVKVLLVDKEAGVLQVGALQGTAMSGGDRLPLGRGHSGIVAATGQPLFCEDCPNDPRNAYAQRDRELGIVTYLGLPIKIRDETVGVLSFNTTTPRHYTPDAIAYLTSFANQAAIALENARLHEMTVRRAQQLATLNELTAVLTAALDPQTAAREILAAVQVLFPGASGRLWEWTEAENLLRLVASVGLRNPEGGRMPTFKPGEGLTGVAAATRQPVVSQDVIRDPRFLNPTWAEAEGLVSCIVLPLIYGDRVTGTLAIYTREPHLFTDEEVRLLSAFASKAAIALENARLHSAAVRRGEQLLALLRATRSVMSGLDLQDILDRIVAEAAQMAGTPHVAVMLADKEAGVLRVAALTGNPVPEGFTIPLGVDLSGVVAQTGEPVFSPDSPNDPRNFLAYRDRQLGFVTYLGLPIKARNAVLGVLTFDTTTPRSYTQEEMAYLSSFADQAAIAIENARLYAETRQHAAVLERRVQERTRELAETRAQAEEASRHKSEFLANMSHELRTPLNSIMGFSQLLQEQHAGPVTERQARFLGHIHAAGQHLLELVNDVLDITKVEAGKLILYWDTSPVAVLLESIQAIARGLADRKDQTLDVQIAPGLPPLRCDPVRFKQICLNLLSNAVKFTPTGGRITLTARRVDWSNSQLVDSARPVDQLTTRPIDSAGAWLEIRVSDTGIGINPDDLRLLFRVFTQLETAATKRFEGTGLGLALTKRLVELHGGRIRVESEGEGRGSTFTVILPFGGPER